MVKKIQQNDGQSTCNVVTYPCQLLALKVELKVDKKNIRRKCSEKLEIRQVVSLSY